MKLTIPTMLTLFRIVLIPVLVLVFYCRTSLEPMSLACAVFVRRRADRLAGWLDRAPLPACISAFGAFLDPVADKLAVTIALFLIVQWHHTRADGAAVRR